MNDGTMPADLEPRKRAMTLEHLMTRDFMKFGQLMLDDGAGACDQRRKLREPGLDEKKSAFRRSFFLYQISELHAGDYAIGHVAGLGRLRVRGGRAP